MTVAGGLASGLRRYRPQLRYGLRVTVAGLAAFAVTQSLNIPLHGLWAVLTAIVVSQISVGGSLRATIEYNIGTLGGALYAAALGLVIPHATALSEALALALAIGPLAFAAAISPSLRVAPFSAVLVLLIGGALGENPVDSAFTRVLEVAIGGAVAVIVSLLVFPDRALALRLTAASRILTVMAGLLPKFFARLAREGNPVDIPLAEAALGDAMAQFQALAEEARRERLVAFSRDPDPQPLARTLTRIRNDFVMLSRATVQPLPETLAGRLDPYLKRFSKAASAFLDGSAAAVASRASAPPIAPIAEALDAYDAEIAALRAEGVERAMDADDVERLFTLGFALEQLRRDLTDLEARVEERASRPRGETSA